MENGYPIPCSRTKPLKRRCGMQPYFPELHLAKWLAKSPEDEDVEIPIYTFSKCQGVLPLFQNYQLLVNELGIDAIVLVHGGTDSLMRGDEDGIGTPTEDLTSLAAVQALPSNNNVPNKILICLGFGVDHFLGFSNDLPLQAIPELTRSGCFLGRASRCWSKCQCLHSIETPPSTRTCFAR